MRKNYFVFDTTPLTDRDSDGKPIVSVVEMERKAAPVEGEPRGEAAESQHAFAAAFGALAEHPMRDEFLREVSGEATDAKDLAAHLQHCNFGEHAGGCKYGDEGCPALTETWEWFGLALQQLRDCEDCGARMNPIGKGIFECWKCVWENAGQKVKNANERAEKAEAEIEKYKREVADLRAQVDRVVDDGIADTDEEKARREKAEARAEAAEKMTARWKAAIENLTPSGSEFVNEPENCAAHIKARCDKTIQFAKERNEARADVGRLREANTRMHEDIEALENVADLRRIALEQVEWIYEDGGECAWCRAKIVHGHKPDCARQAALSPAEGEKGVKG